MLEIRKITTTDDKSKIWQILQSIIAGGDVFSYPPDTSEAQMMAYWCAPEKHTFIALLEGEIVGTFFMQNNQPGLGSHIVNAGYAVSPLAHGQGIGAKMCEFSLEEARNMGYKAMQYNIVVKSNENAVHLWLKMGFRIVGEIPNAFNHARLGMTNAYVMYREL
jgi:ribosomal protein S18 acetylase RimI-like enzyme